MLSFESAFILGLLASIHCVGMCGGVQLALQGKASRSENGAWSANSLIQLLGKLTTYVLLGYAFTAAGSILLKLSTLSEASLVLRHFAALILIFFGLQLLYPRLAALNPLHMLGKVMWVKAQQFRRPSKPGLLKSFINGLVWGLLPCGLLYTVLLSASITADVHQGALIMLGFGVGTVPALLFAGSFLDAINSKAAAVAPAFAAAVFIACGLLYLFSPYLVSTSFIADYPGIVNMIVCRF